MPEERFYVDDREVILTSAWEVRCDGDGLLGHPREFITLAPRGEAVCKYCGRRFVHTSTALAETVRRTGQPAAPTAAPERGR